MNHEWYIVLQDGRNPFIAQPVEDMDGKLVSWCDQDGTHRTVFDDDLIKILDITDFEQVEI